MCIARYIKTGTTKHLNSSTCLNILYLNARSILPKLIELRAICKAIFYDVVCIVETWLDSEISDTELLNTHAYTTCSC